MPGLKYQSVARAHGSSSYRFLIYHKIPRNRNCCCSPADWKPFDRILVVKGPGRDNGEERERGTTKSNVDGELDVLQEVSDEEGDDLEWRDVRRAVACGMGLGMIGNSRRLRSRAWSTTSRQAFDPQSPVRVVGQPTHVSAQDKVRGRASCGREDKHTICPSATSRTWSRICSAMMKLGEANAVLSEEAYWFSVRSGWCLNDAQLEERLVYQSGCL